MKMSEILKEKWFWILILIMISVVLLPFLIVYIILLLPPTLSGIVTICIIIAWGVVAGYKEWVKTKSKEEKSAP